jgi:16S rRNA (uracil1498-N3)-methyltransferase
LTPPPGEPGDQFAAAVAATALVFLDDIGADRLVVEGDDGHHLQRVRRVAPGESVVVADGAGRFAPCAVVEAAEGRLRLERTAAVRAEPVLRPGLAVAFVPAKGDHAAGTVHALVELGVDRIVPVESRRSVVRWRGERGCRAVERLRRVAREAAMLAHRARIPEVERGATIESLGQSSTVVLADRAGAPASSLAAPPDGEWMVVTGPEGGFEDDEIERLAPSARIAVGAHVLRARTAPIAVAAALAGARRAAPPGHAAW